MLQSLPCALNIRTASSRQSSDHGAADDCGDSFHRCKIAIGGNGKASFDHIYTEAVELVRQAQFFLMVHAATGRLFPVAQSGIENGDAELLGFHGDSLKNLAFLLLPSWYGLQRLKQNL
jgi:hypothetical protein